MLASVGDIVTLHQARGIERTWVPRAEEGWWIDHWTRHGVLAVRWRDYHRWSGFFPRPTVSADRVMLPRTKRPRTNYARWKHETG